MGTEDQLSGARRRHGAMGNKEWGDPDTLATHLDRGALLDIIDSLTAALAVQAQATTATIGRVDTLRRDTILITIRSLQNELVTISDALDVTSAPTIKRDDENPDGRPMENVERVAWLAAENGQLRAVDDALNLALAPTQVYEPDKGVERPLTYSERVAWLARRSDEYEPMRAELIRILDLFPNLRASMPGEKSVDITKDLAPAVAALQEQLRSTAKRLDLANEAMRRALTERDNLRQSVLNFIEDAKKKLQ